MTELDIVVHCYNPPITDQYSELLRWQWKSITSSDVFVNYHVAYDPFDGPTARVVSWMQCTGVGARVGARVVPMPCGPRLLFRRAIMRDRATYNLRGDAVWFTDCDYYFGEGCLEAVVAQVDASSGLRFPREILITKSRDPNVSDHELGAAMLARERPQTWPTLDPSEFAPKRMKVAIGGLQIIGADVARRVGYLRDTKWTQPVDGSKGFLSCACDKAWRRQLEEPAQAIEIPNVYRIRHTIAGRDFDLVGNNKGKEAW